MHVWENLTLRCGAADEWLESLETLIVLSLRLDLKLQKAILFYKDSNRWTKRAEKFQFLQLKQLKSNFWVRILVKPWKNTAGLGGSSRLRLLICRNLTSDPIYISWQIDNVVTTYDSNQLVSPSTRPPSHHTLINKFWGAASWAAFMNIVSVFTWILQGKAAT